MHIKVSESFNSFELLGKPVYYILTFKRCCVYSFELRVGVPYLQNSRFTEQYVMIINKQEINEEVKNTCAIIESRF